MHWKFVLDLLLSFKVLGELLSELLFLLMVAVSVTTERATLVVAARVRLRHHLSFRSKKAKRRLFATNGRHVLERLLTQEHILLICIFDQGFLILMKQWIIGVFFECRLLVTLVVEDYGQAPKVGKLEVITLWVVLDTAVLIVIAHWWIELDTWGKILIILVSSRTLIVLGLDCESWLIFLKTTILSSEIFIFMVIWLLSRTFDCCKLWFIFKPVFFAQLVLLIFYLVCCACNVLLIWHRWARSQTGALWTFLSAKLLIAFEFCLYFFRGWKTLYFSPEHFIELRGEPGLSFPLHDQFMQGLLFWSSIFGLLNGTVLKPYTLLLEVLIRLEELSWGPDHSALPSLVVVLDRWRLISHQHLLLLLVAFFFSEQSAVLRTIESMWFEHF